MALVIAMMMIAGTIGSMTVFAEGEPQIHVQGIKAGDTVYTYKVLVMDRTTGKYSWAPDIQGMTDAELTEVVGHWDSTATPAQYVKGSISEATAAKLAGKVKELVSGGTVATGATMDINGTANAEEGLYCILVTAGDVDTVYNPAFAAIDYTQTGAAESASSTVNFESLTYSDTAKVKKSTIDVTKKAASGNAGTDLGATNTDNATTANIGDVITFTVNTTIPAFGKNFTAPKYIVSDSMTAGLAFQEFTSIKVNSQDVDTTTGNVGETTYIKTITAPANGQEWSLTFDEAYLLTNTTPVSVEIVYTAKVTNAAAKNINPDTNTVTIEFSNNPQDLSDSTKIKDETRHYTFSIDMDLLGNDEWEASEFVKIGVDNDGNPITESKTMDNGTVTHPLAGATFKIFKEDQTTPYTNTNINADTVFTTDGKGKLKIQGLDQGTYYLIEQAAPTGYLPDKTPIPVVITATYKTISMDPDGKANSGDEYTYEALDTYTITVGGTASTYTMTNSGENKDKIVSSSDQTKEWANKKGVELPSTGGMGTTLFYIIGAVLVLGAGILLVTRRRMSAN